MRVVLGLIFGALLLTLLSLLSEAGPQQEMLAEQLKKLGLNEQILKGAMPGIGKRVREKTKSKICQEELIQLQDMVEKDPTLLLASQDQMFRMFCTMSRFCIKELSDALSTALVGSKESIMEYIQHKFGVAIPDGVDLETLATMYYDMTCTEDQKKAKSKPRPTKDEI